MQQPCFLRAKIDGELGVQLMMAKSRVAPIANVSIHRLELLGCLIGARLANTVKSALKLDDVKEYFWTDSATALAWIKRNDQWKTFVSNRTEEIVKLSNPEDWRHVPGSENPADLPSRGCTPAQLVDSKWWEGPNWLRQNVSTWPMSVEQPCEEDVIVERSCVSMAVSDDGSFSISDRLSKSHGFEALVASLAISE